MSAASQCRELVRNGEAGQLLDSMSTMLATVGFEAMARDIKAERDFARLQRYARIILKHAVEGNTKLDIKARFQLLGLV